MPSKGPVPSEPLNELPPVDSNAPPLQKALRESNQRFKATFEQAAVGIAHVAPDGSWLRINQRLCDLLGYTAKELKAKTFQEITHPEDLESDLKQVMQVLSGEISSYSMEKRYFHKNGEIVWVNLTVSLVRNRTEKPKYFISVIQDISVRKRTEARLIASEQRFRRAIADAPLPIAICADNGQMLHLSQGWTDITGYSAEEISTIESWAEKAYGKNKDIIIEKIYQLFDRPASLADRSQGAIQTKSGENRIWQFHSLSLGKLENGRKLAMGMAADVTDLNNARIELDQKLAQRTVVAQLGQMAIAGHELQALFDLATHSIAQALDVEYCKVLELSDDGAQLKLISGVGWNPGIVGQLSVANDLGSQAGYTLRSQQPIVVKDLRTESRFSGPSLLADHQVIGGISTVIYKEKDKIYGILGIHTSRQRQFTQADVEFVQAIANVLSSSIERRQAEQTIQRINRDLEQRVLDRTVQLEESNEELKAFTYTVSHDLRAPLRAMEGFAQALQEDYAPQLDDLGQEYTHRIVTAAHQMDKLIAELLAYSQLSRNDIRVETVLLDRIVKNTIAALATEIEATQAEIEISSLPAVRGNYRIFTQVFTDLLSNALKFVPTGRRPKIQITYEEYANKVRIWIADNGIGIAPEHQQRVFNVFERLHGVETYAGTGIGLATVKKGVRRMGGTVGVVSEVDRGSRFWIEVER